MCIGKNIKKYRKDKGLTQNELAKKSNMSRTYLADIENNRYNPSVEILRNIANSLEVPLSSIIDNQSSNLAEQSSVETFPDFEKPEEALKFILEQPLMMAYGGYDLEKMSNDEILEIANDMLMTLRISIERRKRK